MCIDHYTNRTGIKNNNNYHIIKVIRYFNNIFSTSVIKQYLDTRLKITEQI